jgi:hypothetical protein
MKNSKFSTAVHSRAAIQHHATPDEDVQKPEAENVLKWRNQKMSAPCQFNRRGLLTIELFEAGITSFQSRNRIINSGIFFIIYKINFYMYLFYYIIKLSKLYFIVLLLNANEF